MKKLIALLLSLAMLGMLTGCNSTDYKKAVSAYENGDYQAAVEIFTQLGDYKDSAEMALQCNYHIAVLDFEDQNYEEAIEELEALGDYEDCPELLARCRFDYGEQLYENGNYSAARKQFLKAGASGEVSEYLRMCAWGIVRDYLDQEGPMEEHDTQYDTESNIQVESVCEISRQGKSVDVTIQSTEVQSWPILSASLTSVTTTTVSFDGKQPQPEVKSNAEYTLTGPAGTSSFQNVGTCTWDLASYTADTEVVWDEYIHIGTDGEMGSGGNAPAFNQRVSKQQAFLASCLEKLLENGSLNLTMADLGFTSY